jgi:hypothetical protein
MKLLKALGITLTLLLVISQAAAAPNTVPTYDAVKDFSTQSNPNGVWSYGYLASWGVPLTLYAWGGTCPELPGISFWLITQCGDPPTVEHNDTGKKLCYQSVCFPPIYLSLSPGPNGTLSVLRWTAPSSGRFSMQVTFVGLDYVGPTSTYVQVLLNSKRSFLKAPITSYQWPLSFDPKPLGLSAGDTIDFIVDQGNDGDWHYDSTGVEVKIWNLGQH